MLIYLNEDWPRNETGGHLLLLRTKKSLGNSSVIAEVPSYQGNMIAFYNERNVRKKNQWVWHGLREYVGLRRALQINYCTTKSCSKEG